MWYIIGQIIGGIGVMLFFISYLCKTQKRLLFLQILGNAVMVLHFFLIGAKSGYILLIAGTIRNIIFYFSDNKYLSWKGIPYILAGIIVGLGFLSWEAYYSLFIIVGLGLNTVFLSVKNVNILKASVILTSALIFTYDAFAFSISGMINEAMAIVGAIIGLTVFYLTNKKQKEIKEN
jgi:hypothetical protein